MSQSCVLGGLPAALAIELATVLWLNLLYVSRKQVGEPVYSPDQLAAFDSGRRLRARVLQTKCLPPIPRTLLLLLEAIQNETTSAGDLEKLILHDQALAAKVLQVANSAYYGRCGKIITISRAVVTLGFHEVQNICLCALLMEHFHIRGDTQREQELMWQHSFAAAALARGLAQWRPWINNEEAYVLGLLHDLGRMVLMIHLPEDYSQIRTMAREQRIPDYLAEEKYGMPHTLVGKWLATKWHLPSVYQKVMEYHHRPLDAPESHKEVKLIFLADVLAHAQDHPGVSDDELVKDCCSQLYISADEWLSFHEKSENIRKEAIALWNVLKK